MGESHLAWIDLETTGLDPQTSRIIEVALIVTDFDLHTKAAFTSPMLPWDYPTPEACVAHIDSAHPTVTAMHRDNGLRQDILEGRVMHENDVFRSLEIILREFDPNQDQLFMMAGSGVANFDKPFIQAVWPALVERYFNYQTIDIGNIRRFLTHICKRGDMIPPYKGTIHRALDDVQNFIHQARHLRGLIGTEIEVSTSGD